MKPKKRTFVGYMDKGMYNEFDWVRYDFGRELYIPQIVEKKGIFVNPMNVKITIEEVE